MSPVVLVVEEDDNVCDAVCRWVTCMFPEGRLLVARTGRDAITSVRRSRPTIVLLDVGQQDMPAGTMKQFIEALSPATEVVFFSPEDATEPAESSAECWNAPSRPNPGTYHSPIAGVCLN